MERSSSSKQITYFKPFKLWWFYFLTHFGFFYTLVSHNIILIVLGHILGKVKVCEKKKKKKTKNLNGNIIIFLAQKFTSRS